MVLGMTSKKVQRTNGTCRKQRSRKYEKTTKNLRENKNDERPGPGPEAE